MRSKGDVSRFQILVEIAERQPAVRQQEIAEKIGMTPQAVSEYIRDLVDDGMVAVSGRSNYAVTKTGMAWVMENAATLELYLRHIRRDIIKHVSVWTAIAADDLKKGEIAGLYMKDGYLYAGKNPTSATATVYADARKNNDVGIFDVNGIIEHHEEIIHVCIVPRIQRGGSLNVRIDKLKKIVATVGLVAAVGVESSIALKSIGRNPDLFFGASEGVIDAAYHGIRCAIVIVDDESANFVKRLENTPLEYKIHDLILPDDQKSL
ncbi:regulatory protein, ArsR [Methanoregula boonei 6A8]|jgi:putative transcriptional regulator|uniref:Regulatory protein, ArsR n=1 Tax=Methanoregula boonei (strain DSM 21154 / JCM 14090 / 6A8) TaxID=456442 RepID=A7I6Y3_METB6|nr:winged helix-turn-helix transcriptional regulator [Methanoregula boonei]ABS55494.1 regulatory protein, ArsR [Methanoregula boonei 6A8]